MFSLILSHIARILSGWASSVTIIVLKITIIIALGIAPNNYALTIRFNLLATISVVLEVLHYILFMHVTLG